jgi:signal transduction histidine kinase/ActR/RegA family two-component response regulator
MTDRHVQEQDLGPTDPVAGRPRRASSEAAYFARLFEQAPSFMAILRGPAHVFELANPNYLKLVGRRDVIGKRIAQALPDAAERGHLDLLDRVYQSGIACRADSARYAVRTRPGGPADERFVDFVFEPLRDGEGVVDGIFVAGVDSTERVAAQIKRDRLAELAEAVGAGKTSAEISFLASQMLGTMLGAARVGFASVDPQTATAQVDRDWCAPGVATLDGRAPLGGYGAFIDSLKRNECIAIRDVRDDARTAHAAAALEAMSARAFVNMPVVEGDRLVAVFFLNCAEVRDWAAQDLAFIREVAQRTVGWVERVRQTTALRESQAQLLAATDAADLGVWDLCLATQQLAASKHCKANFGRDPALPFTYAELLAAVHADDQARMRAAVAHTIATGEEYRIEYRIVRPDRQLAWVRISGRLQRDHDGAPVTLSGISQEITDVMLARRRAELLDHLDQDVFGAADGTAEIAYRAAEALGRTLDVSRVGYGTVDKLAETITIDRDWNAPGIRSLAGVLHFRDYGSYIEDLKRGQTVVFADARTDPRTRDNADALVAISAQSVVNMPVSEDGDLVALLYLNHATARPWTADEMALVREVAHRTRQASERRRAEHDLRELAGSLERQVQERTAELQESEAALRQSQKMEAVGQLTGGLAHDFNNLLAAVSGSLEMLRRRLGDDSSLVRYIDMGQTATKRAAALTHRLLAFSRQQTLEPKVLGVNQLIGGFEDLIRRTIGPQAVLEVIAGIGVWPVRADPGQLENALLNLCINARDAMPNGGRLVIETANRALDERTAGAQEMLPGQYVSISVSDNGSGMSPEVIARAFDPFFTTKPIGMGTGLGLSMVYGFARQSGGQARIYSEVGAGTNVCIYLPRHDSEAPVEADAGNATPELSMDGEGQTVLVVEDEAPVRALMVELLNDMGYRVLEAGDGPSALTLLRSEPSVQLLITDVGLPGGMNGRHVADAARVITRDLQVLFVTGYAENAVLSHGLLPAGMQVLAKPFDLDVFGQKVQTLTKATLG